MKYRSSCSLHLRLLVSTAVLSAAQPAQAENELPRGQRLPSRSLIEDFTGGLGATQPGAIRPLFPMAPEIIMAFEGWEPSPYDDPSGYCTVGFGHLIKKSTCATLDLSTYPRPLTREEGAELLDADTKTARAAVQRLVRTELKDHEFGALSSFVFNVGKENFAKSTLLSLLNYGHYEAASKEFGKWIVSGKKVLSGLVARRACEAALFKDQVKANAVGAFVRANCDSLGVAPGSGSLIDVATGNILQGSAEE